MKKFNPIKNRIRIRKKERKRAFNTSTLLPLKLRNDILKVKALLSSPERKKVERDLTQEAIDRGFLVAGEELPFSKVRSDMPDIRVVNTFGDSSTLGGYAIGKNRMTIRSDRAWGSTPFHESLHFQLFGATPSDFRTIPDITYSDARKNRDIYLLKQFELEEKYPEIFKLYDNIRDAFLKNTIPYSEYTKVEREMFNKFPDIKRSMEEFLKLEDFLKSNEGKKIKSLYDRAGSFRQTKINEALDPNAFSSLDTFKYLNSPELPVYGLETGYNLGIKPFSKYPGDEEMNSYINKAIRKLSFLSYVKHTTPEEKLNFWKLLTGSFLSGALLTNLNYDEKNKNT